MKGCTLPETFSFLKIGALGDLAPLLLGLFSLFSGAFAVSLGEGCFLVACSPLGKDETVDDYFFTFFPMAGDYPAPRTSGLVVSLSLTSCVRLWGPTFWSNPR